MKTTPVSNIKKFQGLKSHKAILRKIHSEAQELGYDISYTYIKNVICSFFSLPGIAKYVNKPDSFYITGFGHFQVDRFGRWLYRKNLYYEAKRKEKKERLAKEKKEKKKILLIKKKKAGYAKRLPLFISHKKLIIRWNNTNAIMIEKGLIPWTWEEFCRIRKNKRFIKWGTKPWNWSNVIDAKRLTST